MESDGLETLRQTDRRRRPLNLETYDVILVNSSGGKDSQAMLDYVVELADGLGIRHRIVVAHADLGRVEWKGARELAEVQAKHYGLRFEAIARPQGDLLQAVEKRGKWPSPKIRYCTSDHKRGQVQKIITKLGREVIIKYGRARILNCMGLRAQESPGRAKATIFERNNKASSRARVVDQWLPIHSWSTDDVWARIKQSGVPHHFAYDLGMPRLSCCFCIFAPKAALVLAGKHNPELLAEYVAVEKRIGHTFRINLTLADVQAAVCADEEVTAIDSWSM